jgi:hypothetical protein
MKKTVKQPPKHEFTPSCPKCSELDLWSLGIILPHVRGYRLCAYECPECRHKFVYGELVKKQPSSRPTTRA